jgi:hypothetical protein
MADLVRRPLKTGSNSPGQLEMVRSTSEFVVCLLPLIWF